MIFKIKIQDNTYNGCFNLNVVRNFCRTKGFDNVEDYLKRISSIDFNNLSFTDLDDIMLLVVIAIEEQARKDNENVNISIEDIYAQGIESIAGALQALASSVPVAAQEEAPAGNVPQAAQPQKQAGTASKK